MTVNVPNQRLTGVLFLKGQTSRAFSTKARADQGTMDVPGTLRLVSRIQQSAPL